MLNISFRSLSSLRVGEYRDRRLTSSTEESIISNNQEPQNSRALFSLDSLFTTNAPPEADPQKLNNITDNSVTDNPRLYTTSDINLAQISALANYNKLFLRRYNMLQSDFFTNLAELRILIDADINADLMQRPETVS